MNDRFSAAREFRDEMLCRKLEGEELFPKRKQARLVVRSLWVLLVEEGYDVAIPAFAAVTFGFASRFRADKPRPQ